MKEEPSTLVNILLSPNRHKPDKYTDRPLTPLRSSFSKLTNFNNQFFVKELASETAFLTIFDLSLPEICKIL